MVMMTTMARWKQQWKWGDESNGEMTTARLWHGYGIGKTLMLMRL
jgi:hypothetical protein